MTQLPRAARTYVVGVVAAGLLLALARIGSATFDQPLLFAALLLLSSATAALKVYLPITTGGSTLSVSYAVNFMSLLLLGPHETMLVAAGCAVSQCHLNTKEDNPLYRTLFSVASLIITVQGAGLALRWHAGMVLTPISGLAAPLVAAAITYFLLNTWLVAAAIALSTRESIVRTWQNNFLWSAPSYFVGAGTAALAALLITRAGYWIAPLMFVPLYLTYRTYKIYMGRVEDQQKHVRRTSDLHLATIEALARAIDAKDAMTQMHIRRVQVYAAGLARAAGLGEDAIQGIKTAALLHDIGKLAVPEHILSKPGPLTHEEFQKIRIHPQIGADIIAAVPFPYPVAPLILSHHERWDGMGYPQGLKGEEIPIGARILTVVDYFDAISTERPYHKAFGSDSAISLLRHEAGRALDPRLVPRFIEILPQLAEELRAEAQDPPPVAPAPEPIGASAAGLAPAGNNAFDNIALAHREIYALYEIAQSMGTSLGVADTMALISSKLSKLVPWSGCSLFLFVAESDTLKCRFAVGVDAPRLFNTTLKNGEGLCGWVATNRRLLISGDPGVTFSAAGVRCDTALKSAIVCPLHFRETFIGCLALYHVEPNYYGEDHRRLLERIAEQGGPVIHNSIVFEQTQEDSLTDPLTGLPNRRSLFVHLSRELARSGRLQSEMALIVMDVDGFKVINDTYGHSVGDHVLREVSTVLQGALRPYDLCVRYAGDEFIIVLGDCSRETAEAKRIDLQALVEEVRLEVRPGRHLRLAASAGAAVFPHDGTSYEALLAEADQRMYREKAARRSPFAPTLNQPPADLVATDVVDTRSP